RFRKSRLVGVCRPYVTGVLEGSAWLDQRLLLDRRGPWSNRWPALAWKLWRAEIDLAILFPNSFRSAWAARLGGAQTPISFDRYARGRLLTDRLEPVRDAQGRCQPSPIIDDYNRLAVAAGCPWPGHCLELFTTPDNERAADQVWDRFGLARGNEVICLNPGA